MVYPHMDCYGVVCTHELHASTQINVWSMLNNKSHRKICTAFFNLCKFKKRQNKSDVQFQVKLQRNTQRYSGSTKKEQGILFLVLSAQDA